MTVPESGRRDPSKVWIWELAFGGFIAVFGNLKIFAALAAVPFAIEIVAAVTIFDELGNANDEAAPLGTGILSWWWSELLGAFLGAVFAVAWHRFILLGRRDSTDPVQFRLGLREAKFFFYLLLLILPFDLADPSRSPFVPPSLDGLGMMSVRLGLFVLGAVVWVRFCFIFPALAVNADRGLVSAWRETRGVGWRIFWALILVGLIWVILEGIVSDAVGSVMQSSTGVGAYVVLALEFLLGYLGYAVTVGVVSLAYRRRTGWVPGERPVVERGG